MGQFTIYQDNYCDATAISNRFIDEYMVSANDAQLKIYLYLVRAMSGNLKTSVGDMADMFNYTEKDVLRAIKYWEKMHLLTLDYDENRNLSGIHMQEVKSSFSSGRAFPATVSQAACAERVTGEPATVVSFSSRLSDKESTPVAEFEEDKYAKPSYSLDDVKAFKEDEKSSQLLFIAEQYLCKTLSANEVKSILYISGKLNFSEDLIDYLIQYCVGHGKKEFRYIETVAVSWAKAGITTSKQASRFVHKYDKTVYDVMKALGRSNTPTQAEVTYISKWTGEYAFEFDIIEAACEKTVLATDTHRFEYADGILTNWFNYGVKRMADIASCENAHKAKRNSVSASNNKFNQFTQNNYDFDLLEKELLSN